MRPTSIALLTVLSTAAVACSVASTDDGDSNSAAATASDVNADVAALITLDPALPFVPKSLHAAAGPVLDAHWGAHGGPMATQQSFAAPASAPIVTRYFVGATSLTAPASGVPMQSVLPTNLPAQRSWSSDGFVDLPFLGLSLAAYSTSADPFAGEAFLFSKSYDTVVARANVNGYYSGTGVTDGTATRVVYSAFSGFSAATAPTGNAGLWAADVTATSLAASTGSVKLFDWTGSSGPVVSDADGNVFVAAFVTVTGAAHSDEIYAVSRGQALGANAATPATLADADTKGTSSLAVASVKGSGKGWMFAKGYDSAAPAPVYARAYTVANDAVASSGDIITTAIKPTGSGAISVFGSPDGNLWVSVTSSNGAWLVELAPKPTP